MTRPLSLGLLLVALCESSWAAALRIETVAHSPIRAFNEEVRNAAATNQSWVRNPEMVARRFAEGGEDSDLSPQRVSSESAFFMVRTPITRDGVAEMLYLLELRRKSLHWQISEARIAWRCQDSAVFAVRACPFPGQRPSSSEAP